MEVNQKVYSFAPYSVWVGKLKEDDVIHYLVVHDEYEVVEYETEILAAAMAWCRHFSEELKKIQAGDISDTSHIAQNILPFSKPN